MIVNIKEFIKTPVGKLVFACGMLVFVWIILLLSYSDNISDLLPNADDLDRIEKESKKEKIEYDLQNEKVKELTAMKKRYQTRTEKCWQKQRDGDVEIVFREMVENAAKKAEIKLNSLGSVRVSRINAELYYAELDFQTSDEYVKIIKFISKIEELTPCLFWRRAEFRQDMMPRVQQEQQSQTQKKITNVTNGKKQSSIFSSEQRIRFSGNLRVIGYDEDKNAGEKK